MLVADLLKSHEECHVGLYQKYQDFYTGGHEFEKRKGEYLRWRGIERSQRTKGKSTFRKVRLECAHYTPHVAGLINHLIGVILKAGIRIVVEGDSPKNKYWQSLNDNADGYGRDLRSIVWRLLIDIAVHGRAYLGINVIAPLPRREDGQAHSMAEQYAAEKDNPKAAPRFSAIECGRVEDWEYDSVGELLWIRTHDISYERSKGEYGPRDTEVHRWTFHTRTEIREYIAKKKVGGQWPDKEKAIAQEPKPHELGAVPIIPLEVEEGFWLMDLLISTAEAYFNREASREFALDTGALNLPVYKGPKDPAGLVMSEMSCINLGADKDADLKFVSPDGAVYEALANGCEYLDDSLYSALNTMAMRAASAKENPRQSAAAKDEDNGPIEALLSLIAEPALNAVKKGRTLILKMRKEDKDIDPKVDGLNKFDVRSIELLINKTKTFCEIPQMFEPAKRAAMKRAALEFCKDEDDETIQAINKAAEDPLPEVTPAPVNAPAASPASPSSTSDGIRDPRSGEPAGNQRGATRMKNTQ